MPPNSSTADIGSVQGLQVSSEGVAVAAVPPPEGGSVPFTIDGDGLFQIGGIPVDDDTSSGLRARKLRMRAALVSFSRHRHRRRAASEEEAPPHPRLMK